MNISRFFIDRPVFAGVLSVLIFVFGLIALTALPVSEYPEVVPPQIVVRANYPVELQRRTQAFLVNYGRTPGARGDAERAVLKSLHDLAGFVAADNSSLLPAAKLAYQLARQSTMTAQWVNEAARQARLQRIEATYAEQVAALRAGAP